MNVEHIVKICFELLGSEVPPDEISRRTGIFPTIALVRGERNKLRDLPRQNIWSLDSQLPTDDVAALWHELEGPLQRSRDIIKEIAKTGVARFTIVVKSQHRLPSIQIPSSMAEFAGYVNAMIDIDHQQ